MKIVLLGAPGCGKGTFAVKLSKHLKIPAISTGDLVRDEIKKGTPLGREIAKKAASGGLVSDDVILSMVRERVARSDCSRGYILDGFPRTMAQAEELRTFVQVDMVLAIDLNEKVLFLTTVMRRSCANCKQGYNLADISEGPIRMKPLRPAVEGVCDACKGPLIQRADDKEDVVRNRLKLYHEQTMPLRAYYENQNVLVPFEVREGKRDWPRMQRLIDGIRAIRKAARIAKTEVPTVAAAAAAVQQSTAAAAAQPASIQSKL